MGEAATLVAVLERHALACSAQEGYVYLAQGEAETERRPFAALDRRARIIANWLTREGLSERRVLLLLRDGLDFIDALIGCFRAGVVAVPTAAPRQNRSLATLLAIARDADVSAILTTAEMRAYLEPGLAESLPRIAWLTIESADGDGADWQGRTVRPDGLAFLQYTSGSTGAPKGVMVSHANLMHNQAAIQHAMRLSRESRFVSWLPLYHDMGLIGSVMQPLYLGISCVLMPPVAFLQKPVRWLKAISAWRATISGGPNFAYDLAVDKTTREQRDALDLSCWEVAFNGSEPVHAETLERFTDAFASAGFRRRSFYPCYGMAESTLFATGVAQGEEPQLQARGAGPALVGCGRPAPGTALVIVDPEQRRALPEGTTGEIWLSGGSVTAGYYNRPEATTETFQARLAPDGEGPFLRTGDLGFLSGGQLFVTGRLKHLIIIRGRNHHPEDLEATAARANPLLAKSGGIALGIEEGRRAAVAIVHELTREGWRRADPAGISADIREAIAAEHGVQVSRVLLIRPGSLPRTTSGKVRRAECGALFLSGGFETLAGQVSP
jgi:acyl-CoA synthetase (AMP-forming)/AMP-acid ligase II